MDCSVYVNYKETQDPYLNLATEKYFMETVGEEEVILFLWQNRQTVVIGRNQNAWHECDISRLEGEGGRLARRLSGGGAVYHDLGNLNFSFIARKKVYDVERQMSVIADAAGSFGIHAEKDGRNDIKVDGRKFSGNAFFKSKDHCCHHGTILIAERMDKMMRYLNVDGSKMNYKGVDSVPARVVNLADLNPKVTVESFAEALVKSLSVVYGVPAGKLETEQLDRKHIEINEEFFSSWDWRFGSTKIFSNEIEHRFDWGYLRLYFDVENGTVTRAEVDSDSLEADLVARFPSVLKGTKYIGKELSEKISRLPAETEAEKMVVQDSAAFLSNI